VPADRPNLRARYNIAPTTEIDIIVLTEERHEGHRPRRAWGEAMTGAAHLPSTAREQYRELCQDEDGNRYVVIVWRAKTWLSTTLYTLENGSLVESNDDCSFTILATGKQISRCEAVGEPDDELSFR
jgi:hypothetical protein